MKTKLLNSMRVLLAAAGLCVGANAWAYDVPSGYEIKTVYIGTNNGDGTVTANAAPTSTGWTSTIAGAAAATTGAFSTGDVTEVARPNITITSATKILGDAVETGVYPTYVAGSTLQFDYTYSTSDDTNTKAFATYTLTDALTAGKLVMNADFFQNGSVNNRPTVLNFLDSDGAIVLSIYLKDGGDYQYLQYYYNGATTAENDAYGRSNMRAYRGFGLYDLCIDVETGDVSFIFDGITRGNANGNDDRTRYKKSFTITSIKDIKYVQVGTNNYNNGNSATFRLHIDNIALYTVGTSSSSHAYTINAATAGGTIIKELSSGYQEEGDTYNYVGLPYVVDDGAGNFYYLSDAGVSGFTSATYTMGDEDETRKITYTLDEDIVYFNDCSSANAVQSNNECSGGKNGAWNTTQTISGLAAGVYTITVKTVQKYGNYWRGEVFAINDKEATRVAPGAAGLTSVDIVVPNASSPIKFWPTYVYTDYCDYILIKKKSDLPSEESVVVSSDSYATYVSKYNLNFTSTTTKAYKVKVSTKGVATLTPVNQVPAHTPVLLYKAGGNGEGEAIPVTTEAVDAVSDNDLVPGLGNTQATSYDSEDHAYTYMILNKVDGKVGFYFAAGQTVASNRAYLKIATSLAPDEASSRMTMVFADDETAGINSIQNSQLTTDGAVYNLRGQRVAQPTKGLYIVNGKKIIIK